MRLRKLITGLFIFMLLSSICGASEKLLIKGSGTSTRLTTVFFDLFSKQPAANGYEFEVEQVSSKHAGGIKSSDNHLFGRIGQPLNQAERDLNKEQIILGRIPIVFVAGEQSGVKRITIGQLTNILKRKVTNWKELGGNDHKIELIGREESESAFSALKQDFPVLHNIKFDKVLYHDDEVFKYIRSEEGKYSLAFGTKTNFSYRRILKILGFSSGLNVGLVYDYKNSQHPLIEAVESFTETEQWKNALISRGLLPTKLRATAAGSSPLLP